MKYLKAKWSWRALNLSAAAIFIYVVRQGVYDFQEGSFDVGLESGKWAIRFLLVCLAMTPLYTYFGWRDALALRKPAGLWAFAFALVHLAVLVREERLVPTITIAPDSFVLLGLSGFLILAALAVTSNRRAMRALGKWWKRLHRLVYLAALAVATHAVLAMNMSKKMYFYDPQSSTEHYFYLAAVAVLLTVRVPAVRQMVRAVAARAETHRYRPRRYKDVPITPVTVRKYPPQTLPRTYRDVMPNRREKISVGEKEEERATRVQ